MTKSENCMQRPKINNNVERLPLKSETEYAEIKVVSISTPSPTRREIHKRGNT